MIPLTPDKPGSLSALSPDRSLISDTSSMTFEWRLPFFRLRIGHMLLSRGHSILAALLVYFVGAPETHAAFVEDWAKMKSIDPRGYACCHAAGSITIDGQLSEPDWQNAPWTQDFVDIEDGTKPKPRFRTRAKMLWDDHYFYVAAELEEPHIWATLTNHDAVIFRDNDFEVFIDPDGDRHEYYEFEMNALNTGWDLLLKKPYIDGGPALNEWEISGLKTAVRINGTLNNPADRDRSWTVEIAFPWKALAEYAHRSTPPGDGDQWRVNVSRVEWQINIVNGKYEKVPDTREDNWVWSPQGIIDMHRPEKWGFVQFTRAGFGQAKFAPDPALAVRNALQEIYYAERDFEAKNHRWASQPDQLRLSSELISATHNLPAVRLTPDGFEATADLELPNAHVQRWHIRQDGRVWAE